jgi:hypothetical protein
MIIKPAIALLEWKSKQIEIPPMRMGYGLSFSQLTISQRKSALNSSWAPP